MMNVVMGLIKFGSDKLALFFFKVFIYWFRTEHINHTYTYLLIVVYMFMFDVLMY
jgi:hypothetical protein